MKIKNILIGGIGVLALTTSCNDFLDVDAPSQYTVDKVYNSTTEINTALNGVYATILSDNSFGKYLYNDLMLNSDVDFSANSNETSQSNAPKRFDITPAGGATSTLWNTLYSTIETANEFIYNTENSSLYYASNPDISTLTQMVGETKVIRAMAYYELLCYYGDIPFTFEATSASKSFLPPMTSRDEVYAKIIDDLKQAAQKMKSIKNITDGVERISKEACWAMIARMALQAGGYSLRPVEGTSTSYGKMERPANSKEFYATARDFADSVITSGTHSLTLPYKKVFADECNFVVNNSDDAIFEIPFTRETSGGWGYHQGPTVSSNEGKTSHVWGEANGGVRTEAFYRYTFDKNDTRRNVVNSAWYYTATGVPSMRADYSCHNGKWSKLWNETGLGATTTGSTGINFAYIRYADVLLIFAEAENELNGPTAEAKAALSKVRQRAFTDAAKVHYADGINNKEEFLNAVLNERKWEFAGENSRWKDLVRNNKYAETLYYTFLRYYIVAANASTGSPYTDMVEVHDGIKWTEILPYDVFSCFIKNPGDGVYYQNKNLAVRFIANPDSAMAMPTVTPENYPGILSKGYTVISERDITGLETSSATKGWTDTQFYNWMNDDGTAKAQILYSLYGYIRGTDTGSFVIINNGVPQTIDPLGFNVKELPVVRYLLPIPQEAITRSSGVYTQHYGY